MSNDCGSCTLCCKVLGIADLVPPKPIGKWCPNCLTGSGCTIYDERPPTCREFSCVWLQSREWASPLPDSLRPDRCKVVIVDRGSNNVHAHVDEGRPGAADHPEVAGALAAMADAGVTVLISAGASLDKTVLAKQGAAVVRARVRVSEPDADGMQHLVSGPPWLMDAAPHS